MPYQPSSYCNALHDGQLSIAYIREYYNERFSDHRHRNLKAFREHLKHLVSYGFITERYLYNCSWLGVRMVWKLFK